MTRLELGDVLAATGAVLARGGPHGGIDAGGLAGRAVEGVSTDTRSLSRGQLFLALSGPNFDGNRFASRAVEAGAGAVLLRADPGRAPEEIAAGIAGEVPVLLHPDPRRALADLAGWYRSTLDACVLGITGSCGKTTTKNIVRQLFSGMFPVVASPSSFNNDVGVPHTLLLAEPSTLLLAVEIGTNHPGEIASLCRIARPSAGVVTNVGTAHLEGLGTLEGVAREKGDLPASLPRDGFCVLNADCRFTPTLRARTAARVITFSIDREQGEHGDLNARDLYFHSGGTTFRLNGFEVTSPLLGTHNVQNLLAALCVCIGLEIPIEDVLPAVASLESGRQRMERIELEGLTVLDDTWNSNPESLRAAVRVLSGLHGFRRRVLVLGDMLELGDLAAELHHELGREAAAADIDLVLVVGELGRAAAAGALECGLPPEAVVHFEATPEAASAVNELVADGDVVLVKGSRGMRMEEIVHALRSAREAGPPSGAEGTLQTGR